MKYALTLVTYIRTVQSRAGIWLPHLQRELIFCIIRCAQLPKNTSHYNSACIVRLHKTNLMNKCCRKFPFFVIVIESTSRLSLLSYLSMYHFHVALQLHTLVCITKHSLKSLPFPPLSLSHSFQNTHCIRTILQLILFLKKDTML